MAVQAITIGVDPTVIHLGPLALRWYGLLFALAIFAGAWLGIREAARKGFEAERVQSLAVWAIIGGLIGARLFHVIDRWDLLSVVNYLIRRSIWIVGGDGWAYDIGYGGLDHVLATTRDINALVLDTEVYSNTGGQASKATPLGAVAKFASAGKRLARKDLALQTIAYGNVYVAQVTMGANPQQTLIAFREAEAYRGPALILAYSQCIAHNIDMRYGMRQQDLAVASGYWPLFRFNPAMRQVGENPFRLDSPRPTIPFSEYAHNEGRYTVLARSRRQEAEQLMEMAQAVATEKYAQYEQLASLDGSRFHPDATSVREPVGQPGKTDDRERG